MQPKDRRLVTERNLENYTASEIAPIRSSVEQANTTSSDAVSVAQSADQKSDNAITRVEQIETMAGLAPGEVTDAQTANLLQQPGSSTRTALNSVVQSEVTPILAPTLENVAVTTAQRIPKTITVPDGVGQTIPMIIHRTRDGYDTNVNPREHHVSNGFPTYYVDPVDGSDSNDGLTPETPYRTPFYAAQKNADQWGEIVIMRDYTFERLESPARQLFGGTAITTLPGVTAHFITGDRLTGWAQDGQTYSASVASCSGVIDDGYRDPYDDPTVLTEVTSLAEVHATPGTWHFANGTVTVRLYDNRQPDTDVYVCRPVNSMTFNEPAPSYPYTVYLEGVHFWGGSTANLTADGDGWYLYAKDCSWNGASGSNGLSVRGLAGTVLVDCAANNNRFDGFNYHVHNDRTGWFVEVNCEGRNNGRVEGSQNGSSAHGTYRGVRVNGNYVENLGANIADVNNTRTFNVGCVAANSLDYERDFYTNGESLMWLDGCVSNSALGIDAIEDSTMYLRDTIATGSVAGNVQPY